MSESYSLVPLDWLKPHERYIEERVRELMARFSKAGCVDYAVVADAESGTVIDGHHRLEALRRVGARHVPAHLVDYDSPTLTVTNWREHEAAITKDEIVARAREGRLLPPKSTRHDFVRVLDPVDVPLATLQADPAAHATTLS